MIGNWQMLKQMLDRGEHVQKPQDMSAAIEILVAHINDQDDAIDKLAERIRQQDANIHTLAERIERLAKLSRP